MPNKAIAAGGATALAGALTTLVLSLMNHPVDADTAGALTTVIGAVLSGVATYWTPHNG